MKKTVIDQSFIHFKFKFYSENFISEGKRMKLCIIPLVKICFCAFCGNKLQIIVST